MTNEIHEMARSAATSARVSAEFVGAALAEGEFEAAKSEAKLSTTCLHRAALLSLCWLLGGEVAS